VRRRASKSSIRGADVNGFLHDDKVHRFSDYRSDHAVDYLGLFFSFWGLFPKLHWLGSALLASVVSTLALATFISGAEHNLPEETDVIFARFISAMFQCGIATLIVFAWQERR
jgi:hypothetical protein